jgi:hypothetical protein
MLSKKINTKLTMMLIIASLSLCITSCQKWLDLPQQDKVSQQVLFSSEQGYKDALTGVYLAMDKSASSGTAIYTNHLSMGLLSVLAYAYDNANGSSAGGNPTLYNAAYYYNYDDATLKAEIANIWSALYNNVANLNNLLTQIDASKGVFTGNNYQLVKGEALALRALFHFDIVRLFGKPPLVAGTSLAVPYVTSFSVLQTPLISVNDALDKCITDLRDAKNLLATTDTTAILKGVNDPFLSYTQNHCNYWAVKGLMARVFLYKGNSDSADYYAKSVIASGKFPLIKTNVASANNIIRDRTFSQEHLFALYSSNLTSINNTLLNGTTTFVLSAGGRSALYGTPAADNTDWRNQSWFDVGTGVTAAVPSKFQQDNNLPYYLQGLMPIVRVSEMYYIASECANNKGEITKGLNFINQVRNARGLASITSTTVTQDSLFKVITNEYKKEFISEGQTFFYYKRLGLNLQAASGTTAPVPSGAYIFPLPDAEKQYRGG